ncbi:uncharacterized protein LOC143567161 [Bidens hawaiensis]|uniref:uncharacterized protein LOC143567161 n=1 Tax=Bidens hawaiensis TaxID=980011 RepID=UPI004049F2D0
MKFTSVTLITTRKQWLIFIVLFTLVLISSEARKLQTFSKPKVYDPLVTPGASEKFEEFLVVVHKHYICARCAMESFYKPISGPSLVDLDNLPWDPADRKRILDYHPNQRDETRRKYWINEPCQPRGHKFPKRKLGSKEQHFSLTWFDKYGNWLENSIKADKVFCLCCYLFAYHVGNQGGRNVFSKEGFNSWNKPERLVSHVGDVGSAHNKALKRCEDLLNQKQSIPTVFQKQDDIVKRANWLRLNATIDDCRLCLKSTLSFRGHDESKTSLCKGNFLEIWDLIYKHNEELRKLPKAAGNNKYLSPSIQKDVANCFEEEVLNSIFKEIGDDIFALLVDESSDLSKKEQMAIVLRYVDVRGLVKERFVGLVHSGKIALSHQLGLYIDSVRKDERYANLNGIADLARVMVETKKHISFPLVYRLLKLTLVLPVATATVERCFSVVKNVKTKLRNRIGPDFLNACVVFSIEKEAFESVTNEAVINRFQKMKSRRGQL